MSATTTSGCQLAHERDGVVRGVDDGLVEVEWLGPGGEDAVLGGGGEVQPLGFDVLLPAPPGLQRDVVSAGGERAPEGDHGKGVPGVAEGAEQHRGRGGPAALLTTGSRQAASSASSRSCCRRSGAVKAVGVTPSVPTPASR